MDIQKSILVAGAMTIAALIITNGEEVDLAVDNYGSLKYKSGKKSAEISCTKEDLCEDDGKSLEEDKDNE